LALVAHVYNPRYSGGRDEEDHRSKPAQANSSRDTISKKSITHTKKRLVEWLKVLTLSSSPSTTHTHTQNLNINFIPFTKTNPKWTTDLNIKCKV
jgi:hypothetical protein